MSHMGDTLLAEGKLKEAADMHRRAHTLYSAALGEDHPQSVMKLWKVAEASEKAGEYAVAADALRTWMELALPPPGEAPMGSEALYAAIEARIAQLTELGSSPRAP